MWFELITCARTFYVASLPEKDAEEDHGDVGLTISSNGQEYPLHSVCSARKGQKHVESLGVRVSDLRSSVMRMDLGKARQGKASWLPISVPECITS